MTAADRAPNMADVASRAGVSHQTVWRVLNGSAVVRPATRERVLAAVEELGYRRNLAARHLVTNRSMAIGVLGPATAHFGPTSSMYAVEHALRDAGYRALLVSAEPDESRSALDGLLDQSVEALVVIAPYQSTLRAIEKVRAGVPIVVLQAGPTSMGISVAVDQAAGVRAVVDHLVGQGHTRIQHIAGPRDFTDARLRADAFVRHIKRRGLPAIPAIYGDWSPESGYRAAQQLSDTSATAVFCANDQMALGAVHAFVEAGRAVPIDVSVVGFDDTPESGHMLPPLTTVHQDFEAVGHRAVRALLEELGGLEPKKLALIKPRLVIRASTAAPRN
jgi:DNA-binding LacI/PurR family transcriptional regulator